MSVPQLRFSGFEGEWESISFGDAIEKLIGGGTPSRDKEEYYGGEIPWVTVKDLKTKKYIGEAIESITELGLKSSSSKIVNSGDLIIPTRMAVGRILIASKDIAINQDLKGCKIKNGYENEFIYYQYISKASSIEKLGSGSTVSGINIKQLIRINMFVPSFEEQQKVAAFLEMIDRRIDKQQEKIEKLEQFKKGMMQKIFLQELRFKDEDGGEFLEWESYKLEKLLTKISPGATPSTLVPSYWGGEIPWASSGEINLRNIYDVEKRITSLGFGNSSTSIIPKGSVLIALAGQGKTRGKVAINHIELTTNQSLAAMIPNDMLVAKYLFFNLEYRYEELRNLSAGDGGRGGLN